jgi:serine/threonine protein kinase
MTGQNFDSLSQQPQAGQRPGRVCPTCSLQVSGDMAVCPNDGTPLAAGTPGRMVSNLAGQYEFIGKIGEGGMGVVYKARHLALNQLVAVKMLQVNGLDGVHMLRFQQEAKAVNSLDHPSIVRVRDFGVSESGQPHMVLDYIDGTTLERYLKATGRLTFSEASSVFSQICDAMSHAHERHVLHRDLKPGNIMLVERGRQELLVKIVDFGIAKMTDPGLENGMNLTRTGDVFGSPYYMSPEQIAGQAMDPRADIYSLACVLFESLSGTPPFVGRNAIDTLIQHTSQKPPTLKEASMGGEFSPEVQKVLDKALAKDPAARYQTMMEFKADLMHALGSGAGGKSFDAGESGKSGKLKSAGLNRALVLVASFSCIALVAISCLFANGTFKMPGTSKQSIPAAASLSGSTGVDSPSSSKDASASVDAKTTVPSDPGVVDATGVLQQLATGAKDTIIRLKDATTIDIGDTWPGDDDMQAFEQVQNVSRVSLTPSHIEGRGLSHLLHLKQLRELDLSHSESLNDEGYEILGRMKQLTVLDLSESKVTDEEVTKLKSLPNLRQLILKGNSITTKGLRALSQLPKLEMLDLTRCKNIKSSDWSIFKSFPALNNLDLEDSSLDDAGLKILCAGAPLLVTLKVDGVQKLTDEGFVDIANLPSLNILSVAGDHISTVGLNYILANKGIDNLSINVCKKLTDKDMPLLGSRQWSGLDVSGLNLSSAGWTTLSQISIKSLGANWSSLNDQTLLLFAKTPGLSKVYANNTEVTDRGIAIFKARVGPDRSISVYNKKEQSFKNSLRDALAPN